MTEQITKRFGFRKTPEGKLILAVLVRAMKDYIGMSSGRHGVTADPKKYRQEIQGWVDDQGGTFLLVCDVLDLSLEVGKEMVLNKLDDIHTGKFTKEMLYKQPCTRAGNMVG